ncbi:hypothetical protein ACYULU_03685 [Breznakiellaceae bacterium SP9]
MEKVAEQRGIRRYIIPGKMSNAFLLVLHFMRKTGRRFFLAFCIERHPVNFAGGGIFSDKLRIAYTPNSTMSLTFGGSGGYDELLDKYGLSAANIAASVKQFRKENDNKRNSGNALERMERRQVRLWSQCA